MRGATIVCLASALLAPGIGFSQPGSRDFRARLDGFQSVPSLSTSGTGEFKARLNPDNASISYRLSYSGLEAAAVAAHIHLGARATNGGVVAFLCGGGGKPACPVSGGSVEGTIVAADVIGPTGQGIAPGEFAEAVRAMRAGATYVNVHTTLFPAGEIRGQIRGLDIDF